MSNGIKEIMGKGNMGSVFYIVETRHCCRVPIIPTAHENTNDFCINAFQKFDLGGMLGLCQPISLPNI